MILPNPPAPGPRMPVLGRTQARAVWFVLAAGLAGAVLVAVYAAGAFPAASSGALREVFLAVAAVVVVSDLAIGFFVAARVRRSAPPSAPPDGVAATQVIIGSATSLSGGLVCAVFFFITHQPLLLLLVVPCALVLLAWFPSEARWAALRPARGAGEPRRTMVRE